MFSGGPPEFDRPIYFGVPNVGDRDAFYTRLKVILDSRRLTNGGPMTDELTTRVAQTSGVDHCVLTCNATSALQLAIRAFDLTGEVIVPSMTFAATAHAVSWLGLKPVFCDIDPRTHNLDPVQVKRLIGPSTSAVIAVHLWGRPCAVDELQCIAREYRVRLLFDAAHAFGCSWRGRFVGSFGDAEVFSFHATKFVNAFEGGAVVTNDGAAAQRMRAMRNFGIVGADQVDYVGTNAKMSEVCAAMALTSLESIGSFINHNRRNYECYREFLGGINGVELVQYDKDERNNYQYVVLTVDEQAVGMSRDRLLQVLATENIYAKRYFYPGCHRMVPYQPSSSLPHSEALADRVLVLPTGTAVTTHDAKRISNIVALALQGSCALLRRASTVNGAPRSGCGPGH